MNKQIIPLNRGMNKNGGAFYCQNIAPARDDGVYAGLSLSEVSKKSASSTSTAYYLETIYGFAQMGGSSNFTDVAIFGKGCTNGIQLFEFNGSHVCKAYSFGGTGDSDASWAKGIVVDPTGNLVWSGKRYLGKVFATTLSAELAISATGCSLTDASNFDSSGYALIKDATTSNSEVIKYTGKSGNELTGVTKGEYNTNDRVHASGTTVYFFDENWKDLGAAETYNTRQIKVWEDKVLIANGQYVATYSGDGSDFDANKLELPSGYDIVDFGFVPTGSSSKILVCANKDERGTIFVWDGTDTKWLTTIDMENISCAEGVYIGTEGGIYECNGSSINLMWRLPDSDNSIVGRSSTIYDIKEKGNYLIAAIAPTSRQRSFRNVLWIIDKTNGDSYSVVSSTLGGYHDSIKSIFPSSETIILFGSTYASGSVMVLSQYPKANGSQYWYEFKPANAQTVKIKQIKLNVGFDTSEYVYGANQTMDVDLVLRCYDFTKPLMTYAQLKSGETDTAANTLIVSDSLGVPSVGDRIEIVQHDYSNFSDNAGCPRNITAVTAGTGKYTLTLDEDLPSTTNTASYTNALMCLINPLKKIGKISIDSSTNLQDLKFYPIEQMEGKKFIFEIEVRCGNITISPELNYMEVYYDIID